jgi:hypothetical protein
MIGVAEAATTGAAVDVDDLIWTIGVVEAAVVAIWMIGAAVIVAVVATGMTAAVVAILVISTVVVDTSVNAWTTA